MSLALLAHPAGAQAPVSFESEKLTLDSLQGGLLGIAVDLAGDTLVAGRTGFDAATLPRAVVYVRGPSGWTEEAHLVAPDGEGSAFGGAVALDGDTALVGDWADNTVAGVHAGSAYVFVRSGTSWRFQHKLRASDAAAEDHFGLAVALSGDTAAIGAPDGESAYAFVQSGAAWSEQAILVHAGAIADESFGQALDIQGDTIVVGAPRGVELGVASGAVHVFERAGTSWSLAHTLVAADATPGAWFGSSVALDGDTLAVGASADDEGGPDAGAVYVFARTAATWTQRAKLVLRSPSPFPSQGARVDLDGDWIVVGAAFEDGRRADSGAAHVFRRLGSAWVEATTLLASDGENGDQFGAAVAVSGSTVAVGAPRVSPLFVPRGAVYAFDLSGVFPSFCDAADGALATCPCANPGAPDTGCDLAQGTGGVRLDVLARQTAPSNRATLAGSGFPAMSATAVLAIRAPGIDPVGPVVFGNGVRCIGPSIVRLTATTAQGGAALQTIGHGAAAGAGDFVYQLWFRDTPAMFCTPEAFNLSSGRAIAW